MDRIKIWVKGILGKLKNNIPRYKDLSDGWKGGIISLWIVATVLWIFQGYKLFISRGFLYFIIGTGVIYLFIMLITALILLICGLLRKIPLLAAGIMAGGFLLICLSIINTYSIMSTFLVSLIIVLVFMLFGAFFNKLTKGHYKNGRGIKRVSIWVILILLFIVIIGGLYIGLNTLEQETVVFNAKGINEFSKALPGSDNPGVKGEYKVNLITYGSGKDINHKEFGADASIVTDTVDGTAFISNWNFLRRSYLGFGPNELPINGTVWYPEGKGPFPLVVMLHGNHTMTERSDLGYEYLGELLASRGYIFASIDENFLNSSPFDDFLLFNGLKNETDARAYILLEHLKAFDNFNKSGNNPFYNKVDMNNISLIGHSRGGEAVAAAAVFNRLKTYPNNGSVRFDYNYNIRSVVAIAPVDGNSKPTGKSVEIKDVNYLVLHGSDDMDVFSFMGFKQYKRVSFSPDKDNYKASVYIYGANHGQFNNDWGRQDAVGIGGYSFFNIENLMSEADQNMIAKVLVSAFLDSTIKGKTEYKNIFQDIRYADNWLPETIYLNDYYDSKTTTICSYDEDVDINTGTFPGCSTDGENFTLWTEKKIKQKKDDINNNSAYLSWDRKEKAGIPVYTIEISNMGDRITDDSILVFSLANDDKDNDKPIDLSIKVYDKKGNTAVLPLSHFAPLQEKLKTKISKLRFKNSSLDSEAVFQKYLFNLQDFKRVNPGFNPKEFSGFSFIFDKTEKGILLLDDVGIL